MTNEPNNASDRRPVPQRSFHWVQSQAAFFARIGVSPNMISVFGVIAAILAGLLWALTADYPEMARLFWLSGIVLVLIRILANTLDGMVAVEWGKATKAGLLYNDAPDRLSDAALLIGTGYAYGGNVELGYAAACVAIFVPYTRLLARTAGAPSDFSGPMDKGGRMIVLILCALFMGAAPHEWLPESGMILMSPPSLALVIVIFGGLYTGFRRLYRAGRYLNQSD